MRKKSLAWVLTLAILGLIQSGLAAQSMGGGLIYTSYLPFTSLYNSLETENSITGYESSTDGFTFDSREITHYAPGVGITGAFALKGLMTTVNFGIISGAGEDNIIPNFPVRPFIAINAAQKFVNTPFLSLYGMAGFYFDFAYGKGKNSHDFLHFLGYLRLGPGISFKLGASVEIFAQVQFGIGIQIESISLESKAGNKVYEGTYLMVPIALFPELGVRLWF